MFWVKYCITTICLLCCYKKREMFRPWTHILINHSDFYFTKRKHWRSHENTNIRQPTQTIQITDVQDLEKILLRNWFPTRTETRCGLPWQHKLISQRSITDDTNDGQLSNYHNNIFILNFVVIIIIKTITFFIVHLDKQLNVMFTDRVEIQSQ